MANTVVNYMAIELQIVANVIVLGHSCALKMSTNGYSGTKGCAILAINANCHRDTALLLSRGNGGRPRKTELSSSKLITILLLLITQVLLAT